MRVQWYGQSTFHLTAPEASVTIDPFADMSALTASRGMQWDYPPIEGLEPTLLLVTHEHVDHNGVDAVAGEPTILRSTAGRLESPLGEVIAIASEHDDEAGTQRGPNTIFVFELDGTRVAHFGDFGQRELRDEQAALLADVDLMFIPVGDGPTIGAEQAAEIVGRLSPRWVVPMHYRTPRIGFLDTADAFLERSAHVEHAPEPAFETSELPETEGPLVIVPAVP
ncbi:MAG TPA: MBL fold metallo-hydrolase [Solirubrobacteraceae bacterium]|jgi:L-ascorbate metabolism protein UlaG (beta-lactamase superfamily)|nr:MBL fold metallo-hydrolase [Solirubrobacteraceae bacterium]